MKSKVLSTLIIGGALIAATFLNAFCTPTFVAAEDACGVAGYNDPLICGTPKTDEELELMHRVRNVLNVVYSIVGALAAIVIIIAGIKISTSRGDPGKVTTGKNAIFYSLCGLLVTLCAFAITSLVIGAVDGNTSNKQIANDPNQNRNEVKGIMMIKKASLTVGQTTTIRPKVIPDYATDQHLNFKSENSSIASVDEYGTITAKKVGKTKINVSSKNGVSNEAEVEVYDFVAIQKITVSPSSLEIVEGRNQQLKVTISPANATDKTLEWRSDNSSIANVSSSGLVSANKVGKTNIIVTPRNSSNSAYKIKVVIPVEVVNLSHVSSGDGTGTGGGDKKTVGATTNVNYSGWLDFREETRQIVKKNMDGINWKNHDSFLSSKGGYSNYIKSLGGVFAKFGGTDYKIPIKTAADLQEAAEYFYGIFSIYGPDYSAGKRWPVWGESLNNHGVSTKGTKDGFYYGYDDRPYKSSKSSPCGRHVQMSIDYEFGKGYKGESCRKNRIRNNCNYSQDSFARQTDLKLPSSSKSWTSSSSWHHGKTIKHTSELLVGDWVNYSNCSNKFSDGCWIHIAMVGEVYKDVVVLYDGGGRFNRDRHYKKIMYRNTDSLKNTTYKDYKMWAAVRLWDIDQNVVLDGINDKPKNWIW